jgi:site-specific DNA-methyltransferase (adenine-specific)
MTTQRIIPGDCIEGMRTLADGSIHCCVTSPPYWGLRDYGHDGQIGLEDTPEAYVGRMVEVFREVRRVLRDDGTAWVNLGDSYCGGGGYAPNAPCNQRRADGESWGAMNAFSVREGEARKKARPGYTPPGLKAKDLVGIPWRVAFALQADGWWLRQDIIWHKPNPMPESVRDRCTKAHEYVFLLTKSDRYHYDAEAVSEAAVYAGSTGCFAGAKNASRAAAKGRKPSGNERPDAGRVTVADTRNRRSVWTVTTKPYSGAHFAVMPADLVEPCIKAGCPEGGTVLDPFAGSGTTLAVAAELGRNAIGCELNPAYIELAEKRIKESRAGVALFEGGAA